MSQNRRNKSVVELGTLSLANHRACRFPPVGSGRRHLLSIGNSPRFSCCHPAGDHRGGAYPLGNQSLARRESRIRLRLGKTSTIYITSARADLSWALCIQLGSCGAPYTSRKKSDASLITQWDGYRSFRVLGPGTAGHIHGSHLGWSLFLDFSKSAGHFACSARTNLLRLRGG
jgi:hypothetical protein